MQPGEKAGGMNGFRWLMAAGAGLAILGLAALHAAGFGSVTSVLTMRKIDTVMASGLKLGRVGVHSSVRSAIRAFEYENIGGEEGARAQFSRNSSPRAQNALQIARLFNANEPQNGRGWILLDNLVMALDAPSRPIGFISGDLAGSVDFSETSRELGIGTSNWASGLNAAEAAVEAGYKPLGVSATASAATGALEPFFPTAKGSPQETPADSTAPEPASLMLLGTGLLTLGGLVRYRVRSTRRKRPPATH